MAQNPQIVQWNLTYAESDSSTNWRHLYSGKTTKILGMRFLDLTPDETYHYLTNFSIRPIQSNSSEWYIEKIKLWKDNGDGLFSDSDTLISTLDSTDLNYIEHPQLEPLVPLEFDSIDTLLLGNETLFFLTSTVKDWSDGNPEENPEIDEQNGVWFSINIDSVDISVYPDPLKVRFDETTATKYFYIRAINQPVVIRNPHPSNAEDDSIKLNMFFPTYFPLNNDTLSKLQKLTDLSFPTEVFLPGNYVSDSLSLRSASFYIGYDNTILDLIRNSIHFGNIWGENPSLEVDTTVEVLLDTISGKPNYSLIYFSAIKKNSMNDPGNFVEIDSKSIVSFKFRVIKPGISPIFLRDVNIIDRWGIPYHTYRQLQNYSTGDQPAGSNEYDAWSKFILGDFAYNGEDGVCDGRVDWKDITVFAGHIWKNKSDSEWYNRFDIGSPDSHDPDELSPDDTTNFFDLMIMGTNYYRTLAGSFNQKPVSVVNTKINVSLSELEQIDNSDQYLLKFSLSNAVDLSSIHAKIQYNHEDLKFFSIEAGNWVKNVSPNHLLLFPVELVDKGKIDINFIALDKPLCGEGDFALIKFKKLTSEKSDVILEYLDFRNTNCEKVEYVLKGSDDIKELPNESFLLKNYPNPFNPNTEISYSIPEGKDGICKLEIYDIRGKLVMTLSNSYHTTGRYKKFWDGKNIDEKSVGSGIYFLCLSSHNFTKTMKIMLIR